MANMADSYCRHCCQIWSILHQNTSQKLIFLWHNGQTTAVTMAIWAVHLFESQKEPLKVVVRPETTQKESSISMFGNAADADDWRVHGAQCCSSLRAVVLQAGKSDLAGCKPKYKSGVIWDLMLVESYEKALFVGFWVWGFHFWGYFFDSAILEKFTMTSTEKQKWDNLRSNGGRIIWKCTF